MIKKKIAIIGAGISGLVLAKNLKDYFEIKVFEKSRGVGGRMSTRRDNDFVFDHGAQSFCARSREFQNFLQPFIDSGDIEPWCGKAINIFSDGRVTKRTWFETHFVATPNMNSLCKKIAHDCDIVLESEIAPLTKIGKKWIIQDTSGKDFGEFDFVISTAPPKQSETILKEFLSNKNIFSDIRMQPCFALMIGFRNKINLDWIFAKTYQSKIKLISVNSSKPKRNNEVTCFVVHSDASWSTANIDRDRADLLHELASEFTKLTAIDYKESDYLSIHLWRYALVSNTIKTQNYLCDFQNNFSAISDWSSSSRIEEVVLAANYLSEKIITNL
jgi:renalase